MSQLVQLEDGIVEVGEGEVGGHDVGVRVVGGMLDGSKVIDIVFSRHNDDAAGMLTGGALDTHTVLHQTVHLGLVGPQALSL